MENIHSFLLPDLQELEKHMIHLLTNWLKSHKQKYMLLAPTGVAAQNIGGRTIHSALRLSQSPSGFQSLALHNPVFKKELLQIQTIIIDEISMVSAALLNFVSQLFANIHSNDIAFGGINIIVAGDLAQLPPVGGTQVFHSTIWHLFYPLFLCQPRRQQDDKFFYQILEEIRLSQSSWNEMTKRQLTSIV